MAELRDAIGVVAVAGRARSADAPAAAQGDLTQRKPTWLLPVDGSPLPRLPTR
jgi:hypothetical protein